MKAVYKALPLFHPILLHHFTYLNRGQHILRTPFLRLSRNAASKERRAYVRICMYMQANCISYRVIIVPDPPSDHLTLHFVRRCFFTLSLSLSFFPFQIVLSTRKNNIRNISIRAWIAVLASTTISFNCNSTANAIPNKERETAKKRPRDRRNAHQYILSTSRDREREGKKNKLLWFHHIRFPLHPHPSLLLPPHHPCHLFPLSSS